MHKILKGGEEGLLGHTSITRLLLLISILICCSGFRYREPHYCKLVDRVTKGYIKQVAKPHDLRLSGYGGAMMGDIQEIEMSFLSNKALNVNEARLLYVEMMEDYLCRINQYEKIRPYLHNFPFEIDNINLNIGFQDDKNRITQDGHVAMVFIGKNHTIYYEAYDADSGFYTLHKESYAQALKKVEESSLLSNFSSHISQIKSDMKTD